ncbi:hypothetical protein LWC34_54155 [Kibdelosporangium philippinense]|uniref:Uncharacterized protein n=1 Tax=Kibdelosporangium philippinense TaxID=211113 RepID=A0ABS8ZVH4_9PSEU|nr:hypothetical protein [Kibdelosporangium philippinense]MCE7011702.1 hypothetical protein [Kibdelosporangium philippinense]
MSTAGYTQRWRNGTHRWRTAAGPAFKPDRYDVSEMDSKTAEEFCLRHHYSAAWPATKYRFGLFDVHAYEPQLVGVAALGIPMSNQVLTNPFPTLVPNEESLELSRLVLLDSVAMNGESWFCARVFARAAEHGVRGLVSFADPVPRWRTAEGRTEMIKPGHLGIVYQALNFDYLGRSTSRTLTVLPDATVLTARSQAKVTGGERGRNGVVARLVALGAAPPRPDEVLAQWLATALRAIGARRQRHPGNHRYAIRLGRTRGERTRTTIGMATGPYPKPRLATA